MPKPDRIVINTSPLIALVAALGELEILRSLYAEVWVPYEVGQEILISGSNRFAGAEFMSANWLQKQLQPITIMPLLLNSLDLGEASVIQLALNAGIQTVCIDEIAGRRVAKLSGLSVTGSIGILLRGKKEGYPISIKSSVKRMLDRGIRLSSGVINFALEQSGEG
jgi:predicted nucleic acid-binding protein